MLGSQGKRPNQTQDFLFISYQAFDHKTQSQLAAADTTFNTRFDFNGNGVV